MQDELLFADAAFTAFAVLERVEPDGDLYGQDDVLPVFTASTFALFEPLLKLVFFTAAFCVTAGCEAVEPAAVFFELTALPFSAALFDSAEATDAEILFFTESDAALLEAVRFEVTAVPAAEAGCVCATPEQAARLDASTKLKSIEITFFLFILFIVCSPFCKRFV